MPRLLRVGDQAPPFQAVDVGGRAWTHNDLQGAWTIVYFYPKDETPGCIAQSCAYRDSWDQFQALDVRVLGVSRDSPQSHYHFATRRKLPFTLLSDQGGHMQTAWGATWLWGLTRRVSFLIDPTGKIAATYESHLQPTSHPDKMLEALQTLLKEAE